MVAIMVSGIDCLFHPAPYSKYASTVSFISQFIHNIFIRHPIVFKPKVFANFDEIWRILRTVLHPVYLMPLWVVEVREAIARSMLQCPVLQGSEISALSYLPGCDIRAAVRFLLGVARGLGMLVSQACHFYIIKLLKLTSSASQNISCRIVSRQCTICQ